MNANSLISLVGQTDIYLLDLIMKGYITAEMKILDAGCGSGRNMYYFLKQKMNVYAIDRQPEGLAAAKELKNKLYPQLNDDRFTIGNIEEMPFEEGSFDLIISSAVLHFAKNTAHFNAMLNEMWRVLKIGGIFFCRLATSIGIENRIQWIEDRCYLLPDGHKRYLSNETMLLQKTHALGASFMEPLKTTNVQNNRCMSTWVLRKRNEQPHESQ